MSQSAQPGVMPSAPDSPSLSVTVSGNVQKYSIKKKKVLNAEETELFELTQAAGIVMDQEVFKIILDLLKMNVAPLAVFQTLKTMCAGQKVSETSTGDTSTSSHTATAPSESRVRSKTSSGEKTARDGSSQRVPRQVSATRGQKSARSSGSSSSSSQLTSN
ncbi:mitotic-spindle organizing protein 2 isoform X3 [Sinocyclocheilus anshuiensis]|uniref:Mitotic-spindle organizing protein 2 n=1 Tax=Sinocyclocheilus anshuiensis TaxID=1608454 RepID=A0A671QV42_9TELE|nr:PREDICTED: mitotic-spindle organizing protein 2 isoform X3 [Sinocyclocheilus anshuiensis]